MTRSFRECVGRADAPVLIDQAGAIKRQGLALAWARIVGVWLDDVDPGLSKTMAELDRALTRGERAVANIDCLNELASPLRAMAQAAFDPRRRARERRRAQKGANFEGGHDASDAGDAPLI